MRAPDFRTYPPITENDTVIWYRFLTDLANAVPQTGNIPPNGAIKANASCQYIQTAAGASILWFNTIGSGSLTGWVVK